MQPCSKTINDECGTISNYSEFSNVDVNNVEYGMDVVLVELTGSRSASGQLISTDPHKLATLANHQRLRDSQIDLGTLENLSFNNVDMVSIDFNNGLHNSLVFKCGAVTGLTAGEIVNDDAAICQRDTDHLEVFRAKNQLSIRNIDAAPNFADMGDSGSLVFRTDKDGNEIHHCV